MRVACKLHASCTARDGHIFNATIDRVQRDVAKEGGGGEWKNSRVEAGANGGAKGGSAVPAIVDHLATLEAIAPARNHNKCVASNVSDRTR